MPKIRGTARCVGAISQFEVFSRLDTVGGLSGLTSIRNALSMQTFASTDPAASHWPADGSRLDDSTSVWWAALPVTAVLAQFCSGCLAASSACRTRSHPEPAGRCVQRGVPPPPGARRRRAAVGCVGRRDRRERAAGAGALSMRACVVAVVGVWLVEVHEGFRLLPRPGRWCCSAICAPCRPLKKRTRRRRPVVSEVEHLGEASASAATRKSLRVIPRLLSRDANAAFPSGGATGAPVFALAGASTGHRRAVGLLVGACAGRVYWHAHHLLDVAVGAAIGLAVSAAVRGALAAAAWWHALGAEATRRWRCSSARTRTTERAGPPSQKQRSCSRQKPRLGNGARRIFTIHTASFVVSYRYTLGQADGNVFFSLAAACPAPAPGGSLNDSEPPGSPWGARCWSLRCEAQPRRTAQHESCAAERCRSEHVPAKGCHAACIQAVHRDTLVTSPKRARAI